MNPNDLAPEEEQLAQLFAALEADAPPPDEQLRESLRARSAEAFVTQSCPTESSRVHIPRGRSPKFVFAWRTLAASAAAAVLAASFLFFFQFGPAKDAGVDKNVNEPLLVNRGVLTEDGRVGEITNAQGIVSVKSVASPRWTPVSEGMPVMPGDWLRADPRGDNVIVARLAPQTQITIGPGALVEVVGPKKVRVHSGDVKVVAAEQVTEGLDSGLVTGVPGVPADKAPVELVSPDKQTVAVRGTQVFRVEKEKLARLDKAPLWLKDFEGLADLQGSEEGSPPAQQHGIMLPAVPPPKASGKSY